MPPLKNNIEYTSNHAPPRPTASRVVWFIGKMIWKMNEHNSASGFFMGCPIFIQTYKFLEGSPTSSDAWIVGSASIRISPSRITLQEKFEDASYKHLGISQLAARPHTTINSITINHQVINPHHRSTHHIPILKGWVTIILPYPIKYPDQKP